jgi:hypothetical protein
MFREAATPQTPTPSAPAAPTPVKEKEKANPKPTPTASGAFQRPEDKPNTNPGQRIVPPYQPQQRTCKKCGAVLQRDVNHNDCPGAVKHDLDCFADAPGYDCTCKPKAKAAAAISPLGDVDDL